MKIAFIGDDDGSLQNMLLFGLSLYLSRNISVVLLDMDFMTSDLEDSFKMDNISYVKEEAYFAIREGMDYLLYRCSQNMMNSAVVREGATYILPGFAVVKTALQGSETEYIKNITENIAVIMDKMEEEFSLVFVKCNRMIYNNIGCNFDAGVLNICHDKLNEIDLISNYYRQKCLFLIIVQVIGDCHFVRDVLVRQSRIISDNVAVLPFNPRIEIKIDSGNILNFFTKKTNTLYDKIFFSEMENALFKFIKFLEKYI